MQIKYIIGQEIGEQGTKHLQGYIEAEKKLRPSQLKFKELKWNKLHWEKAKGNNKQNLQYCSKENNYTTNFPKQIFKQWEPKKWENIELYKWQEQIIKLLENEPDDRTINWVWETAGCAGKTTFQKYIYTKYPNTIILSGKGADMKNGIIQYQEKNKHLPTIILINIPRVSKDYVSYSGIEDIKDMFFYSGKYEGGMVCGESPHVFCFANTEPDLQKMSIDRWNIININKTIIDELGN